MIYLLMIGGADLVETCTFSAPLSRRAGRRGSPEVQQRRLRDRRLRLPLEIIRTNGGSQVVNVQGNDNDNDNVAAQRIDTGCSSYSSNWWLGACKWLLTTHQASDPRPPLTHGEIARAVAHSDDADAPTICSWCPCPCRKWSSLAWVQNLVRSVVWNTWRNPVFQHVHGRKGVEEGHW